MFHNNEVARSQAKHILDISQVHVHLYACVFVCLWVRTDGGSRRQTKSVTKRSTANIFFSHSGSTDNYRAASFTFPGLFGRDVNKAE